MNYQTLIDKSKSCRLTLIVAAVALISHFRSIFNQFALDDLIHIVQSPRIRSLALVWDSFMTPIFPGNLLRPIVSSSYGLTYALFGLNPLPYHLTNIFLHAIVAILIFKLLKILSNQSAAFLAACVFAVIPLHTEAIANVSGRAELLAATFGLISLLGPLKIRSLATQIFVSSACLFAALLCKESAAVIVLLAPLLYGTRYSFLPEPKVARSVLLALLVTLGLYLLLRSTALSGSLLNLSLIDFLDNPLVHWPAIPRVISGISLLGYYITLAFIPFQLSADYSFNHLGSFTYDGSLPQLLTLGLIGGLIYLAFRLKSPFIRVGLAWYFVAFSVTSNIFFPIGTIFAERLAYLPAIGLCIAILPLLSKPKAALIVFPILVLFLAVDWRQDSVWMNSATLWRYQIDISPESAKTQLNYGVVLRNKGDFDEASIHMREALRIYAKFPDAAYGIGSVYAAQGVDSGAEHWFHEALKLNPDHTPTLNSLGRLHLKHGEIKEAQNLFQKILAKESLNPEALVGAYGVAIAERNWTEALRYDTLLSEVAANDPELEKLRALVRTNNANQK